MSITSISQVRYQNVTVVTVATDLDAPVYLHWYVDGAYIATTQVPTYSFHLSDDDAVRIEVVDTNDADYDPIANAPTGYPARRSVAWQPSLETTVRTYRVEQQIGAGDWIVIGLIPHRPGAWEYALTSPRLADLTDHAWRVAALDAAGEILGTETLPTERIVRTPDAPDFTVAFDEGTTKVTFTVAA